MSLRRSFILVFSVLLTVLAAFAVAFSYYSARHEAWSILDFQLQQVARLVGDGSGLVPQDHAGGTASDELVVAKVVFADGRPARTNDEALRFPADARTGFSTFTGDVEEWRLYTDRTMPGRTVMVAQRTSERDELAADAAWNSAWPFLLAIPLSWLATYGLVGAIMERLQAVAERVERRGVEDTEPLVVDDAPLEIRPLVTAINRAFDRVKITLEQQRAFLADAAHELRTPVTALSLQLDNLKQAGSADEHEAALGAIEAGISRATQVATQLLRLARSDSAETLAPALPVDLVEAVQDCLGRFVTRADAKDIDLGLEQAMPCAIDIDRADLAAILDVVVDNALRYTPENGRVDLAVFIDGRRAVLSVTDTGPGIAAGMRERVFDRFFRIDPSATEGSGLGLSIARNLVGRSGGTIRLADNPSGPGLRVVLDWPLT